MSGPKIDKYELERRRQEQIRREQEERVKRIKIETDKLCKEQELFCKMCDSYICLCNEGIVAAKAINDADVKNRFGELRDTCLMEKARCLSAAVPTEPEEISGETARLKNSTAKIKLEHDAKYKRLTEELAASTDRYSLSLFSEAMELAGATESRRKRRKKTEEADSGQELKTDETNEIDECLQEVVEILRMTSQNDTREEAIRCYKMLQEAKASDSESRGKVCTRYCLAKTRLLDSIFEFDNQYHVYVSEYVAYVETLNAFQTGSHAVIPKPKAIFRDGKALAEEIRHVKALSLSMREHIFVREQIDAIMAELGYGMCEEIVFSEGQSGVHYICVPNEAETASIHVYVSDHSKGESRVMMEVVAADEAAADLAEGQNAKITTGESMLDYEKEELVRAQGQFCTIHPQIVKKLAEKGILLTTASHQKPDAKFCKKVSVAAGVCVNLCDYSDAVYKPVYTQAAAVQALRND